MQKLHFTITTHKFTTRICLSFITIICIHYAFKTLVKYLFRFLKKIKIRVSKSLRTPRLFFFFLGRNLPKFAYVQQWVSTADMRSGGISDVHGSRRSTTIHRRISLRQWSCRVLISVVTRTSTSRRIYYTPSSIYTGCTTTPCAPCRTLCGTSWSRPLSCVSDSLATCTHHLTTSCVSGESSETVPHIINSNLTVTSRIHRNIKMTYLKISETTEKFQVTFEYNNFFLGFLG